MDCVKKPLNSKIRPKLLIVKKYLNTKILPNWMLLIIRPLAKLSKAVKVADASNQGKTEGKALSSVTVTFREDTKPFEKTDGVFNKDTFS